ncbi:MAG: hypothetical protein SF162_08550 [bacterium]|nr:hypothetical protein [bacterium]
MVYLLLRIAPFVVLASLCALSAAAWLADHLPRRLVAYVSDLHRHTDLFLFDGYSGRTLHLMAGDLIAASDRAPAWSPDGGRLAFASFHEDDFDIRVIDWDGRHVHNLTANPDANEVAPAWSPDGTRIAYIRQAGGVSHLCILTLAAPADRACVSETINRAPRPVWSPDGRTIAFSSGTHTATVDLAVYDLSTGRTIPLSHSADAENFPNWEPDGGAIWYARSALRDGQPRQTHIVRHDLNGESETIITTDYVYAMLLSPDGTRLAYTNGDDLTVIDAAGTLHFAAALVTPFDLAWSADSSHLAFTKGVGAWDVYLLDVAAGRLTRIDHPGNDQSPAWRP